MTRQAINFWYLASPYSKSKDGLDAAFQRAAVAVSAMLAQGVPVFSPIVHSHAISVATKINPLDAKFWLEIDKPMMHQAHGLVVAMMDGWDVSEGVAFELAMFRSMRKPILFISWPQMKIVSRETPRAPYISLRRHMLISKEEPHAN